MAHKTLNSRHVLESCTLQLHNWKPFHLQQTLAIKTLEPSTPSPPPPPPPQSELCNSKLYSNSTNGDGVQHKRPCLSDRSTAFSVDSLDLSRLSLFDDERNSVVSRRNRGKFQWMARKRRRRGSRSVSGRSSDRSGTRRCCSVGASAAYATCSDFPVAAGTDSSGELFVNGGDANWSSDVSEARNSRREGRDSGGEKENLVSGCWQVGAVETQGNESGYGSEPGYRGDGEFGYGDEFDEEEDDGRALFWGEQFGDTDTNMEMVGENSFSEQKVHHRCRRKKHDCR